MGGAGGHGIGGSLPFGFVEHDLATGTDIVDRVAIGDVDGDGKLDILGLGHAGKGFAGRLNVLKNLGNGGFANPVSIATIGSPNWLVLIDIDGDKKLDVVVASLLSGSGPTVQTLLNQGNGKLKAGPTLAVQPMANLPGFQLSVADVDGDKVPDLLAYEVDINAKDGDRLHIYKGHKDGSFDAPTTTMMTSPSDSATAVTFVDADGDGVIDLLASHYKGPNLDGEIRFSRGKGDGTFGAPVASPACYSPIWIATGDFNGDNKLDLAMTGQSLCVDKGHGDGTFDADVKPLPPMSFNFTGVAIGDFNLDKKPDVVTTIDSALLFYFGNGDGTIQDAKSVSMGGVADFPVVGDLDGDGKDDIVMSGGAGVRVLFNVSTP